MVLKDLDQSCSEVSPGFCLLLLAPMAGSSSSSDDENPRPEGPRSDPPSHPQPKQLGIAFEEEKVVRRRLRDKDRPYMTRWINDKAISVPSVKAMSLNDVALVCIAKWWCPSIGYPKAVPIDLLRAEVGDYVYACILFWGVARLNYFLFFLGYMLHLSP